MIQLFLMDNLKSLLPDMLWTTDFKPRDDNTVTIFYEGGGAPGQYDVPTRYPRYMVYISSSNWDIAEYAAELIYKELPKLANQTVTVNFYGRNQEILMTKQLAIKSITSPSEPQMLGTTDNIRDYSVNFDVILIEKEEEI